MLGFRKATYNVESTTISSESLPNLNSTKYIYLALEEFNKNKQNSFTTPLSNSLINNNILSRMTVNNGASTFGDLIVTNHSNGNLISDKRNYSGTVDLQYSTYCRLTVVACGQQRDAPPYNVQELHPVRKCEVACGRHDFI